MDLLLSMWTSSEDKEFKGEEEEDNGLCITVKF